MSEWAPHRRAHHLVVVERDGSRFVASVLGTPYKMRSPTPEWALGALIAIHGERLGLHVVRVGDPKVEAIRKASRCAVPVHESGRA